ncbi:hypothetical protein EVAR_5606_1 [Eumeta japonica]|uniref:Uncharacterized protein n=1 Tax=Eumeta variegata TaxID=151549 RepID=A0A4C1U1E7_EUMVA|nr:hypothetical protein EVAR_5606_1 [Eumeta japonica]
MKKTRSTERNEFIKTAQRDKGKSKSHQRVRGHPRPWTLATPGESPLPCRPLRPKMENIARSALERRTRSVARAENIRPPSEPADKIIRGIAKTNLGPITAV